MKTVYHFFDYWNKVWKSCKVEILSETEKTAEVKLLEFGPNNAAPGTVLKKVHKKSLDAFKEIFVAAPQRGWGAYNYM
jgi:hypothetical protein